MSADCSLQVVEKSTSFWRSDFGERQVAPGTSSGGALKPGLSGIRLGGGVNPDQALFLILANDKWPLGRVRAEP
jgi:hypothetical protein